MPRWARRKASLEFPSELPDPWLALEAWGVLAIALAMAALFALFIFLGLVLPLVLLLVGVVAGLVALLARLASVSRWTVRAESTRRRMEWRVRGLVRSKRTMREVAAALERGEPVPAGGAEPVG